jgi:hypothetical protein
MPTSSSWRGRARFFIPGTGRLARTAARSFARAIACHQPSRATFRHNSWLPIRRCPSSNRMNRWQPAAADDDDRYFAEHADLSDRDARAAIDRAKGNGMPVVDPVRGTQGLSSTRCENSICGERAAVSAPAGSRASTRTSTSARALPLRAEHRDHTLRPNEVALRRR